jgi:AraC-like DNA-binding protein
MTVAIRSMALKLTANPARHGPTVSASYLRTLIDFAARQGAERSQLHERSGVDPASLSDPDARIPLDRLKALMATAKALCGDPAFALRFGADPILYETTIVGLIIRSSQTMGEAFREFSRYARLVIEVDDGGAEERFSILRHGDAFWLEDRRRDAAEFPEMTETAFARLICDSLRLFTGRPNFFKAVEVAHAPPSHSAEYEQILRTPVKFSAGRNAVLVDAAWFDEKPPGANRYSFGVFSRHAAALLAELEDTRSVCGAVEKHLIETLHKGDVAMRTVAELLHMSAPTLYRRLREEGTTFEAVLDNLRFKMAARYLHEEKLSVNETAYLVGFSDAASLSRAYKRWTGAAPRAARVTDLSLTSE